ARWNAPSQRQRAERSVAFVLSRHPPGKLWQEVPVTPGSRNHWTRQGKEVPCWSYGSITQNEMMGVTRYAYRLTQPKVAHYLIEAARELADLLGISLN